MNPATETTVTVDGNDLWLERTIAAPAAVLYRCWTDPALLPQWFCPRPWGVSRAELDVRPGGICLIVMRSPEGQEFPNPGVYLEVVPNRRLVSTDAFGSAWVPSGKAFMVCDVNFEDLGDGRTRYRAGARHWTLADREAHERMGFRDGWTAATQQLAELAQRLQA